MTYSKTGFRWLKSGMMPPETLQNEGFTAGSKVPADYLNAQWAATYEAIKELQEKSAEKTVIEDSLKAHTTNNLKHNNYATCNTSAATAAKTVTLADFVLSAGTSVSIKFTAANTATAVTLNVNSTGAKALKQVDGSAFTNIKASIYTFIYDGTNYVVQDTKIVEDSVTSISTVNAASASSVKKVYDIATTAQTTADSKVDKEAGKGLSTNDYTTTEKTKLAGIAAGATNTTLSDSTSTASSTTAASSTAVKTVNDSLTTHGNLSASTSAKGHVQLTSSTSSTSTTLAATASAVKATYDMATTAQTTAEGKVDKEAGKGLSTNDYTTTEKTKLAGIAAGATNTTLSDSTSTASSTTAASSTAVKTVNDSLTTHSNLSASTSAKGHVQLTSSTSSTSTTLAATASAVKATYDMATTAQTTAEGKVDKEAGKVLSTNDYSGEDMAQVASLKAVFDKLQKKKITNDDGSAIYTIGATLPAVVKGVFYCTATNSGTYAAPKSSVEGLLIAESSTYWNFIGFSDDGTMLVSTLSGSTWRGWKTYELTHFVDDAKTINSLPNTFSVGTTLTMPAIMGQEIADVLLSKLGINALPSNGKYNVIIKTYRTPGYGRLYYTYQKMEFYTQATVGNSVLDEMQFTLERTSKEDAAWSAWGVKSEILTGLSSPQGVVYAYRGMLYNDVTNGKLYRKNQGTDITLTNTGWVLIG